MKLFFLTFCIMLLLTSLHSQDCITKNTFDDSLQANSLETKWIQIHHDYSYTFYFRIITHDTLVLLDVKIINRGLLGKSIDAGNLLILYFQGNKPVRMKSVYNSVAGVGGGSVKKRSVNSPGINANYKLISEDLQVLAFTNINKIKIAMSRKYYEKKISYRNANWFRKCVMQYYEIKKEAN